MHCSSWVGFLLTSKWRLKSSICETRVDLCQHCAELDLLRLLTCVTVSKIKKKEEEGGFHCVREGLPAMDISPFYVCGRNG